MRKINFNAYDHLSNVEEIMEQVFKLISLEDTIIASPNFEDETTYLLMIITILYKEMYYNRYYEQVLKNAKMNIKYDFVNERTEIIINTLKKYISEKDYLKAQQIIYYNGSLIEEYIERYFERKNKNYIQAKRPFYILNQQNQQNELLHINPFAVNQSIKYYRNPITPEEKIISDMLDYLYIIKEIQRVEDKEEKLNQIKHLFMTNYKKHLNDAIIFIICDVYQETLEQNNDSFSDHLKNLIENKKITTKKIIQYFKSDEEFANIVLAAFLYHNKKIENGRLEELKTKPSYVYVKERMKKTN